MPAAFDDLQIGQVVSLGAAAVDPAALDAFIAGFAPGWTADRGAPDAMVYAIWARLDAVAHTDWPQTKRLGVDAKGIVICQHDLLDEAGRLVFSCLTRGVFAR